LYRLGNRLRITEVVLLAPSHTGARTSPASAVLDAQALAACG
jgi:hypothetical protein